ncbi:MAG: kelch repeat-containing protein [bacterium]
MTTRSASLLVLALIGSSVAGGCRPRVEEGRFFCDPDVEQSCPDGWLCLPLGPEHRCYSGRDNHCGDHEVQPGEQCDGDNFVGECGDYGQLDGHRFCTSLCTVLCIACGNGAVERGPFGEGEGCDDGNLRGHDGCSSSCEEELPQWTDLTGTPHPPARSGHAMVSDSAREVIVLFGGSGAEGTLGDLWEYGPQGWTQLHPPTLPSARTRHAMVYDSERQWVVLYGGAPTAAEESPLGDTWVYDGEDWWSVDAGATPAPRSGHAMAFDRRRGRVVLFGGNVPEGGWENTWEFDGTQWQEFVHDVRPGDRRDHRMVYAEAWERIVLFGGANNILVPLPSDEVWEYDGQSWQQIELAVRPSARWDHGLSYDPNRKTVVLFGGATKEGVDLDDTWEYDGAAWSRLTPALAPSARSGACADHVAWLNATLLVGGVLRSVPAVLFAESWSYRFEVPDAVCGDGIQSVGEVCDGSDLGGSHPLTCWDLGFGTGTLRCRPDCRLDLSDCGD